MRAYEGHRPVPQRPRFKVFIEQGREFTIREALAGINQLLNDDMGGTGAPEAPSSNAEPYTRQFFLIFLPDDAIAP